MERRRVLIVDDEVLARLDIGERLLRIRSDCHIAGQAGNGAAALEMIERFSPDLALIDIKMPVMNGIEVIRKAREAGYATRFIVLSCFEEYSLVREALQLGADDYLLKHTCTDEELNDAVNHALKELDQDALRSVSRQRLKGLMWQQLLDGELGEEDLLTCVKAELFGMEEREYMLLLIGNPASERKAQPGYYVLGVSGGKGKVDCAGRTGRGSAADAQKRQGFSFG